MRHKELAKKRQEKLAWKTRQLGESVNIKNGHLRK